MADFYLVLDVILLGYACYSWYWQANIKLKSQYRISSIISSLVWALVFVWLGSDWQLVAKSERGLGIFLALFLLLGIIDGVAGFTPQKVVVSGYFRRTVSYADIALVTLIRIPNPKKKQLICILTTQQNRQYYLRFSQSIEQVVEILKRYVHHDIRIEIQDLM